MITYFVTARLGGHEFKDDAGNVTSQREGSYLFSCRTDGSDARIHCGGGMHRTGIVIGVLQRVINQMPMEAIAAEYRYHVSYKSGEQPGGFEQGNLDFIRDFDPNLIVR